MVHVDALSRCHAIMIVEGLSFERNLSIRQDCDAEICKIRDRLEENEDRFFELRDGLVYRKHKRGLLFYVPESMESNVIRFEFAFNNTKSRVTGKDPTELLFSISQRGEIHDSIRMMLEASQDVIRDFEQLRSKASASIMKNQKENEKMYDQKRKPATMHKEGDYVMIKNVDTTVGINKKLIPQYKGPYVVYKVLDRDRYVIRDIDGFQVTQLPYDGVVSPDRMRLYVK